ncbi:hypothetical protein H257_15943 [Aphanomyces astaci]|uniref:PDZ domain-containing protein n=1 Tax=Aphanomyces astaci TaxID=112090 RepID=W4FKF7_APHAT|nr:hypothetical protein H257_15943 [Aphanomyces astaci]ETV67977.1 hypothetical protein H257_15943 [Aphanomyces astaci]|eukprot:XP_009842540.1 hypothetical protein H257_15943 [Aphanomyces astaci]
MSAKKYQVVLARHCIHEDWGFVSEERGRGRIVTSVVKDGPADRSGLKQGSAILQWSRWRIDWGKSVSKNPDEVSHTLTTVQKCEHEGRNQVLRNMYPELRSDCSCLRLGILDWYVSTKILLYNHMRSMIPALGECTHEEILADIHNSDDDDKTTSHKRKRV